MEIFRTETFKRQYKRLPPQIQEVCHKKLGFLLKDFRYPSLRAKKVKGHIDIWEASLTMNYRFTFHSMFKFFHSISKFLALSQIP